METPSGFPPLARNALAGALFLFALLLALWYAIFHIGFVDHVDDSIYLGFGGLVGHPHVGTIANHIADLCDPRPYLVLAACPVAVALYRRRFLLASTIVWILAGANETTSLLKPALAAVRPENLASMPNGTWPSGHATAAMTLALVCVLASPARLRPYVAACGSAFAVAVAYSFLTLGWHYPSDALGGFLVAGLWTLLGIAWVSLIDARMRQGGLAGPVQLPAAQALAPPAIALSAALVFLGLILAVRPGSALSYAREHLSFIVGAIGLGGLGWLIATGVMMTLSGSGPGPTAAPRRRWHLGSG